ncbi:phosphorylcholine transferase LicD [Anaerovibrio lipolyticus]|uniref:LicD family protein n=1 Tax=Anaerovibrio lipolyticus TaxID=82374 RepID=UPI0026F2BE15|nr:LicD family protein [Anaerovibrio lipolyticus]
MSKIYVKDIEKDEIRSGFLVTTDRKKIWQKEIELLLEVDRICKKHDIPYFVSDGTMLGCARHKGFIPWDDDIDVSMMRPDYMKFVQVAAKEVRAPYFLQNTYTDNRILNWSKLMDDSTSAIENWDTYDIHQGIFVDVLPLDAVADGMGRAAIIDEMSKEVWMCVIAPRQVKDSVEQGALTHVATKTLEHILERPLAERMEIYEDFCVNHFEESSKVAFQMAYWCNRAKGVRKEKLNSVQYMNFEEITVPVPTGYEEYLTEIYGQWQTPKCIPNQHEGVVMSVDVSYGVMMKNINRDLLQCGDYLWHW